MFIIIMTTSIYSPHTHPSTQPAAGPLFRVSIIDMNRSTYSTAGRRALQSWEKSSGSSGSSHPTLSLGLPIVPSPQPARPPARPPGTLIIAPATHAIIPAIIPPPFWSPLALCRCPGPRGHSRQPTCSHPAPPCSPPAHHNGPSPQPRGHRCFGGDSLIRMARIALDLLRQTSELGGGDSPSGSSYSICQQLHLTQPHSD